MLLAQKTCPPTQSTWRATARERYDAFASRCIQPARLTRDVLEKAEAFLREELSPARHELPSFVAMMTWLAAPNQ
jgi:hypothetical protein